MTNRNLQDVDIADASELAAGTPGRVIDAALAKEKLANLAGDNTFTGDNNTFVNDVGVQGELFVVGNMTSNSAIGAPDAYINNLIARSSGTLSVAVSNRMLVDLALNAVANWNDRTLGTPTFPWLIAGDSSGGNALAGYVGEYVESKIASGSAISLTTATPANITSISLTAGDWDVEGNVNYSLTAATVAQNVAAINSTSATVPTDGTQVYSGATAAASSAPDSITLPRKRISISATTTVYLVANVTFLGTGIDGYGFISARRVR